MGRPIVNLILNFMVLPCPIEKISQIKNLLFIGNWKLEIGNFHQRRLGFTFIELLIVVAIMGVLTSIGVASYNNFNDKRVVENAAAELKSNLSSTQSKAVNNEKPTSCADKVLDGWYLEYINNSSYKTYAHCGGEVTEYDSKKINLERATFDNNFGIIQFKVLGGTNLSADLSIGFNSGLETVIVEQSGDIK